MCDKKYQLYWWATEPYSEPADPYHSNLEKEEAIYNQVDGLIMQALHSLFLV